MSAQALSAYLKILRIIRDLQEEDNQNRGQSQGLEDLLNSQVREPVRAAQGRTRKAKKKVSAYHKKYSKEFKQLAPKFKKKNGSWKKDGFKRCAAAARKKARR